jgi:osmotically-inducible protein OsmY
MNEDLKLQQRVIDELEFTPEVNAAHIGISVHGGVVTLSGHVESLHEKHLAEAAVRRVKGVRAVAQELAVHLPSDRKTDDDEIAARAVHLLDWDAQLPSQALSVRVSQGIVTLTGNVEWDFQRRAAEADVRKLGGVRGVINEIRLKPKASTAEIRNMIHAAFERAADLRADGISVETSGSGVVVLRGKVHTLGEQVMAENAAWAVPGVTSVENRVDVA